jgi:hypothetical protein
LTPHAAGTPGQGGASFSSWIVTAAAGYSSCTRRAIAPASASISRNVDFVGPLKRQMIKRKLEKQAARDAEA